MRRRYRSTIYINAHHNFDYFIFQVLPLRRLIKWQQQRRNKKLPSILRSIFPRESCWDWCIPAWIMDICMQSCDDFLNLYAYAQQSLCYHHIHPLSFPFPWSIPTNNTSKQVIHNSEYNTTYENTHGHDWNDFTQSLFKSSLHSGDFWGVCGFKCFYVVYERLLLSVEKKIKNR